MAPPAARFDVKSKVLCYHGQLIYEGKVLNRKFQSTDKIWEYLIHYSGWKSKWDEWVPEDRVLQYNDENLVKKKEVAEAVKKKKKNKKPQSESAASSSPHRGLGKEPDSSTSSRSASSAPTSSSVTMASGSSPAQMNQQLKVVKGSDVRGKKRKIKSSIFDHYHQPEVVDLHLPILLKEYAKSLPSLRYNGNMTSTAFSTEMLRLRRDEFNRLQGLNEPSTSLPTTTPPSTPPRTSMPPPSTEAASTSTLPPCARGPVPSIPSSPVQVVMKFDPHDDRPRRELLLPEEEPPSDTDDLQNEDASASPSPLPATDMVETMDTVEASPDDVTESEILETPVPLRRKLSTEEEEVTTPPPASGSTPSPCVPSTTAKMEVKGEETLLDAVMAEDDGECTELGLQNADMGGSAGVIG
ncbi:unnamed protein product [Cyprideis torosa]|uniref:Uncharacterized protein n=1 Tax=Cyprideis torosa TaxID=163714 RepID=A0A7R8WI20_9CRUS|nr:unnamed protein product [Cyprideis torosa]CAG0900157.1 unnamed protein product [Cyprideis torosa]